MAELGQDSIPTWCQQDTTLPLHPLLIAKSRICQQKLLKFTTWSVQIRNHYHNVLPTNSVIYISIPSSVNSTKAKRRTEFGSPHTRQSTTCNRVIWHPLRSNYQTQDCTSIGRGSYPHVTDRLLAFFHTTIKSHYLILCALRCVKETFRYCTFMSFHCLHSYSRFRNNKTYSSSLQTTTRLPNYSQTTCNYLHPGAQLNSGLQIQPKNHDEFPQTNMKTWVQNPTSSPYRYQCLRIRCLLGHR